MDDLETMLTLKFSLQKEQNCYSSLSTQVRSWIRSLFLHSIHACLLERKFNYVHISLFQAGIGKHFHVLFLFYFSLIVSFSICLIIGIRIQKPLSNVCRFLGSRIWTTRTDHHCWRLEPSKWKDEQGALSLKYEDEFKCICFLYCDCQTWSRSYSTSIVLEEASLEKKTLCEPNRPWCSLSAWGNYSRVVDPGILVRFKLLLFNCEHMSFVDGPKESSPWCKFNWNAVYVWKFVALSVLTERIWIEELRKKKNKTSDEMIRKKNPVFRLKE